MYVVTALGAAPSLTPSTMNCSALRFSGELMADFLPSSAEDLAAGREGQLEEVAGQALVGRALVDDAALGLGVGVERLPGGRGALDLVVAVVDEAGVGRLRDAEVLVVEVDRSRASTG